MRRMVLEARDWLSAWGRGARMSDFSRAATSFLRSARNEATDLSQALASGGAGDLGQ